ncbi:DMT family transporter [Fulvimarina sp. MAC3]|uniref:DMT family transporter n=1 Tax=Fulvimarina sp. MAC3 TaxID=3148887 RepID=UPI0031FDE5ED
MWIEITVAAAFFQNLRSALQKRLKAQLSTTGATFVRFGFGLPFALIYLLMLESFGFKTPAANIVFAGYVVFAAIAQIAGTALLVLAFSYRNFMAATVYSKTEPIIAALFGFLIIGDRLSTVGIWAIVIGLAGVLLLSFGGTGSIRQIIKPSAMPSAVIGLSSGVGFAFSAIGVRGAALALENAELVVSAAMTLVCVISLQTVLMTGFMLAFERHTIGAIARNWRVSLLAGFCGAAASIGWFTAMAMQPVALVKTVGQSELLFAYAASLWWFRETISRTELMGCGLVLLSVLLLIQFG